jgi:hypothetical protein
MSISPIATLLLACLYSLDLTQNSLLLALMDTPDSSFRYDARTPDFDCFVVDCCTKFRAVTFCTCNTCFCDPFMLESPPENL